MAVTSVAQAMKISDVSETVRGIVYGQSQDDIDAHRPVVGPGWPEARTRQG